MMMIMKIMKMKMKMKIIMKMKIDDNETMSQNETIKYLNDLLDEIIDKSKSFEGQIKSLKKRDNLREIYPYEDFGDKKLKFKYFNTELADMSNEIDKKLFSNIWSYT